MTILYDGVGAAELATRLGLPRVVLLDETTSTMDDAHALADQGAPSGTLVLAQSQTRGRGRSGGSWMAVKGSSILCTLIERVSAESIEVLPIRVGLGIAMALEPFGATYARLKWPNDVILNMGKVAGILIEARWRKQAPEWVAIAVGINVTAAPADVPTARCISPDASRLAVLDAVIPAMRAAAQRTGELDREEMAQVRRKDMLRGQHIRSPIEGIARGILATGELEIETVNGRERLRAGTIMLEND